MRRGTARWRRLSLAAVLAVAGVVATSTPASATPGEPPSPASVPSATSEPEPAPDIAPAGGGTDRDDTGVPAVAPVRPAPEQRGADAPAPPVEAGGLGQLTIELDAVPNDGRDFAFTVCGTTCSTSILDDDAENGRSRTVTLEGLTPGTHTVTQAAVSGWTVTSIVCGPDDAVDLPTRQAVVALAADESTTCTFVTEFSPSIGVRQDSVPDDAQDFDYTVCPAAVDGSCSGAAIPFTLDDDPDGSRASIATHPVAAGRYVVTQAPVAGWRLTAVTCSTPEVIDVARRRVIIELGGAEATSCVFTTRQGTVTIEQNLGPQGPQDFTYDVCPVVGPCRNATLDDDPGDTTFGRWWEMAGLAPGTWTVRQRPVEGHPVVEITCGSGQVDLAQRQVTLAVEAGQTLACRFVNRTTSLTIVHDSQPNSARDVAFTTCAGGDCTDVSLDDDEDDVLRDRHTFAALDAGTYTVTQGAVPGWTTTALVCSTGETIELSERRAVIDLVDGEQTTCTFTSRSTGVAVAVETRPEEAAQDFALHLCPVVGPCRDALVDTDEASGTPATTSFDALEPGIWTLTQEEAIGWGAVAFSCGRGQTDLAARRATFVVAAGDNVSCEITNAENSLTIQQDALPRGPQDFSFTGCAGPGGANGCATFALDDDTDATLPDTVTFAGLRAGLAYTITQQAVPGYRLADLRCTDGDVQRLQRRVTVVLEPGDQPECTFVSHTASLTIVTDTTPNDPQDITYTGCAGPAGALGCAPFVLDDDSGSAASATPRSITFTGLDAGVAYSVRQGAVAGFGLTSLSCSGGNTEVAADEVTAVLDVGQQVTCTFANRPTQLTITQSTQPAAAQDFTFTGCAGPGGANGCSTFALDSDNTATLPSSVTFRGLQAGTAYQITQGPVTGYGLTELACTKGVASLATRTATVVLEPGDQVSCTFRTRATQLTIEHRTSPAAAQDFTYSGCAGPGGANGCGDFVLDDDSASTTVPSTLTSSLLTAGMVYAVTQQEVAGYGPPVVTCTGGVVTQPPRGFMVVLDAGDQVTCRFETPTTRVAVTLGNPGSDPQDFSYTFCGPAPGACQSFVLDGDVSQSVPSSSAAFSALAPGDYTVTQDAVAAWRLDELVCPGADVDLGARRASMHLDAGEQVVCTFVNRRAALGFRMHTNPSDATPVTFDLCPTGGACSAVVLDDNPSTSTAPGSYSLANVTPGEYTITQRTEIPGFGLASLTCDTGENVDRGLRRVIVDVADGEQVQCVFDLRRTSLTVAVQTNPWGSPQDFNLRICGPVPCEDVVVDHHSSDPTWPASVTSNPTTPGTYTVQPTPLPDGWSVVSVACTTSEQIDLAAGRVTIDLTAGKVTSCTFTMRQAGPTSLTVATDTLPDAPRDLGYTLCPLAGGDCTRFLLDNGDDLTLPASRVFDPLEPGAYSVTQDPVEDWVITTITCDNGDAVDLDAARAVVHVTAGEQARCTFANTVPALRLTHDTEPNAAPTFTYDVCVVATSACQVVTLDNGSNWYLSDLVPGAYTIDRRPVPGWRGTQIHCGIGDTVDPAAGHATVEISVGETAWCWFINVPEA